MGGCASGELPEAYLPHFHLDTDAPLDISIRKSATRIVQFTIRQQDSQRLRQAQKKYGGKNVVIEVVVRVKQGALAAVRVVVQPSSSSVPTTTNTNGANNTLTNDIRNPRNWSTAGYIGPKPTSEPVQYDAYGRVLPSVPQPKASDASTTQTIPGGTATLITPANAASLGADANTGLLSGFYGPFATGVNTPAGWLTYVPHHVSKRTRVSASSGTAQQQRYADTALYGPDEDLGLGGIRFRITAAQTRNFSVGDYYISMVCTEDGRAMISASIEVDMTITPLGETNGSVGTMNPNYNGMNQSYNGMDMNLYPPQISPAHSFSRTNNDPFINSRSFNGTNGSVGPASVEGYQNAPSYVPNYAMAQAQMSGTQPREFARTTPTAVPYYNPTTTLPQQQLPLPQQQRVFSSSPLDAHYSTLDFRTIEHDAGSHLSHRQRAYFEEQHALIVELRNRLSSYEEELHIKHNEIEDLRTTRPTQVKYFDLEEKFRAMKEENFELRKKLQELQDQQGMQTNDLISTLESQLHAYKLHAKKSKEIILKLNDKVDEKRRKVALVENECDVLRKRLHYRGAGVSTVPAPTSSSITGGARIGGYFYESRNPKLYKYLTKKEYAAVVIQKAARGMIARKCLRLSKDTVKRRKEILAGRSVGSRRYKSEKYYAYEQPRHRYGDSPPTRSRHSHHRSSHHGRSRSRSYSRSPVRYEYDRNGRRVPVERTQSHSRSHSRTRRSRSRSGSRSRSRSPRRSSSSSHHHRPSSSSSSKHKSSSSKSLPLSRNGRRYTHEEARAAEKIQASYRGFHTRRSNPKAKLVRSRHRSSSSSSKKSSSHKSSSSKKEPNPYAKYAYNTKTSSSSRPSSSSHHSSSHHSSSSKHRSTSRKFGGYPTEEDYAAAKIQAGFKGMKSRRKLKKEGKLKTSSSSKHKSSSHHSSSSSHNRTSSSSHKHDNTLRSPSNTHGSGSGSHHHSSGSHHHTGATLNSSGTLSRSGSKSLLKDPAMPRSPNSKRSIQFEKELTRPSSASKKDLLYGIDLNDKELQKAAAKIQAEFRGHLFRKKHPEKVVKKRSSKSKSSKSSSSSHHSSHSSHSKDKDHHSSHKDKDKDHHSSHHSSHSSHSSHSKDKDHKDHHHSSKHSSDEKEHHSHHSSSKHGSGSKHSSSSSSHHHSKK